MIQRPLILIDDPLWDGEKYIEPSGDGSFRAWLNERLNEISRQSKQTHSIKDPTQKPQPEQSSTSGAAE